ncbi:hypothetical protein L1887_38974 [Cichorium endivia]|nr:hypothetical protein L1887_38974 [Cichorium endivia]
MKKPIASYTALFKGSQSTIGIAAKSFEKQEETLSFPSPNDNDDDDYDDDIDDFDDNNDDANMAEKDDQPDLDTQTSKSQILENIEQAKIDFVYSKANDVLARQAKVKAHVELEAMQKVKVEVLAKAEVEKDHATLASRAKDRIIGGPQSNLPKPPTISSKDKGKGILIQKSKKELKKQVVTIRAAEIASRSTKKETHDAQRLGEFLKNMREIGKHKEIM